MRRVLDKIFTWWSGATIGTLNTIRKRAKLVGEDQFGTFVRERLEELGVRLLAVPAEGVPTGLTVVLSEPRKPYVKPTRSSPANAPITEPALRASAASSRGLTAGSVADSANAAR